MKHFIIGNTNTWAAQLLYCTHLNSNKSFTILMLPLCQTRQNYATSEKWVAISNDIQEHDMTCTYNCEAIQPPWLILIALVSVCCMPTSLLACNFGMQLTIRRKSSSKANNIQVHAYCVTCTLECYISLIYLSIDK